MAKIVWVLLVLTAYVSVPEGYTLIETYQLLKLLHTPGLNFHLLEVFGINEVEVALQPHIPTAKGISLKHLSDLTFWPVLKTPSQPSFVTQMKTYGIKRDSTEVVLYDRSGVLYSAKAWWVLTVFGKDNVKVLNGGLPKWIREGYMTVPALNSSLYDPFTQNSADYLYELDLTRVWSISELPMLSGMLQAPVKTEPVQLIDVRAKSQFDASSVKGSINMPIEIVRRADGTLRSAIELNTIFQMYSIRTSNDTLTVVMGFNGVDSSTALLSLSVLGNDHSAMVEGGWLEYTQWLKNSAAAVAMDTSSAVRVERVAERSDYGEVGEVTKKLEAIAVVGTVVMLGGLLGLCCRAGRKKRPIDFSEKWL